MPSPHEQLLIHHQKEVMNQFGEIEHHQPKKKKKWHWIDDDRIPSQAEIDFYASFDEEGNPTEETTITQDHLDEIGLGEGGEGLTTEDVGSGDDDEYAGKGYAQRTQGYNPFLKIKKETQDKKGKFTRGSLRVRKPKRMAV